MTRFSVLAAAASALLPVAAFAQTITAEVRFNDLDLTSSAGAATLEKRIEMASRQACRSDTATGSRILAARRERTCKAEVRRQVEARMSANGAVPAGN